MHRQSFSSWDWLPLGPFEDTDFVLDTGGGSRSEERTRAEQVELGLVVRHGHRSRGRLGALLPRRGVDGRPRLAPVIVAVELLFEAKAAIEPQAALIGRFD